MQRFVNNFHQYSVNKKIAVIKIFTKLKKIIVSMRNFIKVFGVLFLLLFQLTSCLNDDYNRKPFYYFYDEPVVVNQLGGFPIVQNESYLFYVPGLVDDTAIEVGNLLWTSFTVDLDNQESADPTPKTYQYLVKHFQYKKVDSANVVVPESEDAFKSYLSDDYSASMNLAVLYNYRIDSLWFFGFRNKDHSNYVYELILNPEIEQNSGNYPTLYIRSKQVSASTDNIGNAESRDGNFIFAFDVADFVKQYQGTTSNNDGVVRFNLKYKIGVDANGNDIYRPFMSNPIAWNFKK